MRRTLPLLQKPTDQRHRRIRKKNRHHPRRSVKNRIPQPARFSLDLQTQNNRDPSRQNNSHNQRSQHLRVIRPHKKERSLHLK